MTEKGELVPAGPGGATAPDAETTAKRAEIEALIPHRDPFLLVDAIESRELTGEGPQTRGSVTVSWHLDESLDFYRGHYPSQPVTPGVMLCEHSFQAGAILVSLALRGFAAEDGVPVLTRIGGAKFKRMVKPGDTVTTTVEVTDRLGPAWYMNATIKVGGKVAVKLDYVLSATDAMARVDKG